MTVEPKCSLLRGTIYKVAKKQAAARRHNIFLNLRLSVYFTVLFFSISYFGPDGASLFDAICMQLVSTVLTLMVESISKEREKKKVAVSLTLVVSVAGRILFSFSRSLLLTHRESKVYKVRNVFQDIYVRFAPSFIRMVIPV